MRGEIEAAVFANKTADLIVAGIVNARGRLYNDMMNKFTQSVQAWPIELAMADVQNYHSKCSLYGGLLEASASVAVTPVTVTKPAPNTPTARPTGPADSVKLSNANLNVRPPATRLPTPDAPAASPLARPVGDFLSSFATYVDNEASNDDLKRMMTALKITPDATAKRNRALLRTFVYTQVRNSSDKAAAIQLIKDTVKDIYQF